MFSAAKLPKGITLSKDGRFVAHYVGLNLGTFNTVEEALAERKREGDIQRRQREALSAMGRAIAVKCGRTREVGHERLPSGWAKQVNRACDEFLRKRGLIRKFIPQNPW